jgi:F-type H+-transporting ATPase subunit delta
MNPTGDSGGGAAELEPHFPTVLDVGSQRVARVYAQALLDAAGAAGQVEDVLQDLDGLFADVIRADPEFEAFLASGAIGRRAKAEVIERAFAGRANPLFVNFLLVLNEHDRLDLLRGVRQAAREISDERAGRMPVLVRSAVPLPDDQRERLRGELREAFRKEPVLETRVDPALLGGLVVRVGDWLYDASVRARLEEIRNQLIASGSHEIQSRRDHFRTD